MATPFDASSYANRKLGGGDWTALKAAGYNPGQFGQTLGGYQVYGAGQGDVRLRAVPGAAAPAPAPAPIAAPRPAAAPVAAAPAAVQRTASGSIIPSGPGTTATTPQTAGGATVQTQFRDQLLKQLATNPDDVKLTDPTLAPQMQAYRDQQQRALEQAQQAAAEQGFQGGALGTGAYNQELASQRQQAGEQASQYGAGLIGNQQAANRQQMANSLGLAAGLIGQGEDVGLNLQDLALKRMGLDTQASLGQGQLQLGQGQLGLGLLQALMGDKATRDRLGFDIGAFGANYGLNSMNFLK